MNKNKLLSLILTFSIISNLLWSTNVVYASVSTESIITNDENTTSSSDESETIKIEAINSKNDISNFVEISNEPKNLNNKIADYNAAPSITSTKTAQIGDIITNTLTGLSFKKTDNTGFRAKPTKYGYRIIGPARTLDGKTLNSISDLQEINIESALIKDANGDYEDTRIVVVVSCDIDPTETVSLQRKIIDFKTYHKDGSDKSPFIITKEQIENTLNDMQVSKDTIWDIGIYYLQDNAPNIESPWNTTSDLEINELEAGDITWSSKVENNRLSYKPDDYVVRNFVDCDVQANSFFDPGFNQLMQTFTYLSTSDIMLTLDKTENIQPNDIITGTFEISNNSTYYNSNIYFGFHTEPTSQFELLIDETSIIPEKEGFYQPTKESWFSNSGVDGDGGIRGALAKKESNKFNWYKLPGEKSVKISFKIKVNENYNGDDIKLTPFVYISGDSNNKILGNTVNINGHSFQVQFNTNGGEPNIPTQEVKKGSKINKPEVSRLGFTLDGWYTDENFTTKWNFDTDIVASNIMLHAKWKPNMEVINSVPTINAEDKILTVGDSFNPLDGVSANDNEDGEITLTEENIISNNVDMSQAGTYSITYKVTDKNGASALKTIIVVVNPKLEALNHIPTINATDKVLIVGDSFNPLDGVSAYDEEDGEITLTEENIISNNVDMSQAGTYSITYKVTDKNGASALKTITVVVNPKLEVVKPENNKPTVESKPEVDNKPTDNTNKLPNTGVESSLPLLGVLSITIGVALSLKKKQK